MNSWLARLLRAITALGSSIHRWRIALHGTLRGVLTKLATGSLLLWLGLETIALVSWVLSPFTSPSPYRDLLAHVAGVEETLLNVTVFLCPLLLLVTLYMWVARLLRRFFTKELRLSIERQGHVVVQKQWGREDWGRLRDAITVKGVRLPFQRHRRLVLAVAIALSILLPLYPYHPGLNPEGQLVGVDAPHYLSSLNEMVEGPPTEVLPYLFWGGRQEGSRPLYLLLLYVAKLTTGLAAEVIIRLQPLLLAVFLTVATYFLVREATGNEGLASFSALFTPLTFQTTAMMFGAFYANWLAVAELYVALGVLLMVLREASWKPLTGVALASIALLYTHPWTWDLFMAVLGCYLLVALVKGASAGRSRVLPLALLLVVNLAADAVKELLMGSFSGFTAGYRELSTLMGVSQIAAFWPNLTLTLNHYLAGYLGNPVVLALAMLGVTPIVFVQSDFHWIVGSWLALTSILFPLSNHAIQGRLLLNLPFQFLLTAGLAILTSHMRNRTLANLVVVAAILVNLNYALRCLANLLP